MLIDLQLHSTYSDGYMTPVQLVEFLKNRGVQVASLTDHDTVSGLEEFKKACKKFKIKFLPGLELYVKLNGKKFNVLWYNFDCSSSELHKLLRDTQMRRRGRVRGILENLVKKEGFILNIDRIIDSYNHYVPINHVVDDLIKLSYNRKKVAKILNNSDFRERDVIREFFKNEKYGVLYESYISIKRVIKIRKKIGGQLILNHPGKYGKVTEDFFMQLKDLGIDGVEVLSPHHSINTIMYIQFLARKIGWRMTGGSDYHKSEGQHALLQNSWDYFKIDSKFLKGVSKIIK
ncbi:PHP domain-containing protein [Candidatus Parcubacteria bacterium]|nr:PHP domain-containing protein [Candidatus Parcubacteria bacterium]